MSLGLQLALPEEPVAGRLLVKIQKRFDRGSGTTDALGKHCVD
jgi:hypothetical protein